MLIKAGQSMVLLIDAQARLVPAVDDGEAVVGHMGVLARAARQLEVPLLASEQYPEGIGPTVPALRELLQDDEILTKRHFSCAGDPGLLAAIERTGRPQIVLGGVEAHVCVLQTALDLAARGLQPVVAADAVGSRRPADRALALQRMAAGGVTLATTEMVLFEWLERSGTPAFKAVLPLIK